VFHLPFCIHFLSVKYFPIVQTYFHDWKLHCSVSFVL